MTLDTFENFELETVALGDIADDVEAKSHPVRMPCSGFATPVRRLEDPGAICLVDAWAVIDDVERPRTAITPKDHSDMPTGAVVADRVLDEVPECLLDQGEIASELHYSFRDRDFEGNLLPPRDRSMTFDDPLDESIEVDRVFVGKPFGRLQSCCRVEIVKKRAEILRLLEGRSGEASRRASCWRCSCAERLPGRGES